MSTIGGPRLSTIPTFQNTYSLDFDGVDDYVDCGDSDTFSFGNGTTDSPFSISAWINMDDATTFRIANKYTNTDREYIFSTDSSDRVSFALYDLSNGSRIQRKYNTALTSFQGQWINVIGTYDGSSSSSGIKIYLNGARVDDIDGNLGSYTAMENTTQPFEIGRNNLTSFANGKIDEVSVFDKVLTPTEITSISAAPTDLTDLSPIAWYRMGDNGAYKSPQWLIPNNENKDKVSNYSFEFDGVGDYVSMGNVLNLANDGSDAISISIWLKTTLSSLGYLVSKQTGFTDGYGVFMLPTGEIAFYLGSSTSSARIYAYTQNTFNNNDWHNVVITYDGSQDVSGLNIYVNNTSQALTVVTNNTPNNVANIADFAIGMRNGDAYPYLDYIDEVSVFNSELSASDVTNIYNGGEPTTLPSGAVAHYKMGEEANFTSNWLVDNSALDNYSKRSFEFDGVDDFVDTGITNTGTNDVSISCWINTTETFVYTQSRCAFGGSDITYGANYTLGRLGSQFSTPNDMKVRVFNTFGTTKLNDGNWHNIIYTYDYTTQEVKAYVDGNTTPEISTTVSFFASKRLSIGWNGITSSYHFQGKVDECALWYSVLGASDITAIYNGGQPTTLPSGAVAHWRMGEEASFNGTNWTVPDQAGTNNGTSANMTVDDLVGEAPNYSGGGISNAMTIEDRVGEAPSSDNNALSINMEREDRVEETP